MPQTWAELRDKVELLLEDTGNSIWSTARIDGCMEDSLQEISDTAPYIRREELEATNKSGEASSTSAGELVDASKSQFEASDVGKVVWNITDTTIALVTAYTDADTLVLDSDIMASGESYKILQKECVNNKQFNLEDITDWMGGGDTRGIIRVEYPIGADPANNRNFAINRDILTIGYDGTITDNAKVYLEYKAVQRVSRLTDLAGAVKVEHAAGVSEIDIDGLESSGTIYENDEFTIAGVQGTYRVTADGTISSNEVANLAFYPALLAIAADDAVVTFKKSTLHTTLERILIKMAAGHAAIREPLVYLNAFEGDASKFSALTTSVTNMTARIEEAVSNINDARGFFNKANVGRPEQEYLASARQEMNSAASYLGQAKGHIDHLNQRLANIKVAFNYKAWGEERLAEARAELYRNAGRRGIRKNLSAG